MNVKREKHILPAVEQLHLLTDECEEGETHSTRSRAATLAN